MTRQLTSRTVTGMIMLLLGTGFLLQTFNVLTFGNYLSQWWPLIVIAFGLVGLVNGAGTKTGSLVTVIVGAIFLLWTLDFVTANIFSLMWPLILIVIGFSFLTDRRQAAFTSEEFVDVFALFGASERRLDTKDFAGANLTAIFGGVKLDLRKATMASDATINAFTAFGGGEIIVPENCRVIASGFPVFGGWDDKTQKSGDATQTLTITGVSLFGGLEIKN